MALAVTLLEVETRFEDFMEDFTKWLHETESVTSPLSQLQLGQAQRQQSFASLLSAAASHAAYQGCRQGQKLWQVLQTNV